MNYRKFEPEDRLPVYRLFRDSIWHYMQHLGIVQPDEEYDLEENYRRQQGLYLHLEKTAAEDWVAEDEHHEVAGWARSIERDGHLQLTHFFVSPGAQSGGIGRSLLERAFPLDRGRQRSIIATTNPNALSLYLRQDVQFQSMAIGFTGAPRIRETPAGVSIQRAEPGAATLAQLLAIDSKVLGFERSADLEFFMRQQPVYLCHRDGQLAGYAFGSDGNSSGPAAALAPQDLPALLQQIETSACAAGIDELGLMIPAVASAAVSWALASGYRIDPFYEVLLAKTPMQLDRYLLSESTFLW